MVKEEKRYCFDCEVTLMQEEGEELNGNLLCATCFGSYYHCAACGNLYNREAAENEGAWGDMCMPCSSEHFVCGECRETFNAEAYSEEGLCENCVGRRENQGVRDYHSHLGRRVCFLPNKNQALYFGVELETDKYDERRPAAKELVALSPDEELFWLENDSSLDCGIELITQPCSLDYHLNKFPWETAIEIIERNGGHGQDTGTAALHIHFNRSFLNGKQAELQQLRLVYLFEKFRDELLILGRTSDYLQSRSAKKYNCPLHDTTAKLKMYQLECLVDRMQSVNITNRTTIEIRIFRSTLQVTTIKASIELVDFLVRLAKNESTRQLQKLSWRDMLKLINKSKYRYLPLYVRQHFGGELQCV